MSEEPHYLETLYKELALALGDAVWAFARIEWLTYKCLRHLSKDRLDELVGDLGFRNRTSILRRLIENHDSDEAKKKTAFAAIKSAEDLSEQRNIIVHNPWQIWVDLDSEEFMMQIEKYSKREKNVDIEKLKKFIVDSSKVEKTLKEAVFSL